MDMFIGVSPRHFFALDLPGSVIGNVKILFIAKAVYIKASLCDGLDICSFFSNVCRLDGNQ